MATYKRCDPSAAISEDSDKGAEVAFARETRRSNLRGIALAKGERFRRTWIPTTAVVTAYSAVLWVEGFDRITRRRRG
jgi:hypothetical protein